jgi:hypothetical protein
MMYLPDWISAGSRAMSQNRIQDNANAESDASAVPPGFILISAGALPVPLARAMAAQQQLYRLAYQQAREAVESTRRTYRWMFRAAQADARN